MNIKKIKAKNFMRIGDDPIEINFDSYNNVILIEGYNFDYYSGHGSNGCGKSALTSDLIVFALFGKTIRGQNIDKCINRRNKKGLLVELEINDLKIIRGRKPDILELYEDGNPKPITMSSKSLTQDLIESKIGINFQSFINIISFGGHNFFSFLTCNAATKKSIVEGLLDFEEYNRYESISRKTSLSLKKEMAKLSGQYEIFLRELENKTKQIQGYKQKLIEFRNKTEEEIKDYSLKVVSLKSIDLDKELKNINEYELLSSSLKELLLEQGSISKKIKDIESNIQEYKSKIENNRSTSILEIDKIKKEIRDIDKIDYDLISVEWDEYEKFQELTLKLQKEIVENQSLINDLQNVISPIIKEIGSIDSNIQKINDMEQGVTCPSCLQKVDPLNSKNTLKEFESKKKDLITKLNLPKEDLEKLVKIKNDLSKKKKDMKVLSKPSLSKEDVMIKRSKKESLILKLEEKESNLKNNPWEPILEGLNNESNLYLSKLPLLEEEIKKTKLGLKEPKYDKSYLIRIEEELKDLETNIKTKTNDLKSNPYEEFISNLESEISDINKSISSCKERIKIIEDRLPYYDFWINGFGESGIKSYIVENIIGLLNHQVNYWLQFLFDNKVQIKFDKCLEAELKTDDGEEFDIVGASSGEKRRIDFAISLAFSHIMRLKSKTDNNILFLDEIADNLDIPGLEGAYRAIMELSKERKIFIITHHPYLKEKFANCQKMIIYRKDGYSHIAQNHDEIKSLLNK